MSTTNERQVIPATVPMWALLRYQDDPSEVVPVVAWEVFESSRHGPEPEYVASLVACPMVVHNGYGGAFARSMRDPEVGPVIWSVWPTEEQAMKERRRLVTAGVE